ncbi:MULTISPECIES: cellulose biosynthesis protein BcsR [unclassified Serratia (in: enterobacteria)]|uniref:cellulose biosynthesis protein BcsR n=1 Tax=unclassified Serratia (in: enterobacteria) TaxID=2647522 RepID=UPI000503F8E9|nr:MULTISPECIES: cellulose biosynthesis protein BcsR [unclassified Serratia (in: enterobacteria)]KFK93685.1 hypothetical protein JV45_14830 [Serratia sp. Ag2]KFK98950.1 hypothetical protein IV04_10040 [Serratia sp. Ag1]
MNNGDLSHFRKAVEQSQMQDDLVTLTLAFSLPELNYIDILRQERLAKMMDRWPLLAELAQKK